MTTEEVVFYKQGYSDAVKECGWHDLRHNPADLPDDGDYVIVELKIDNDAEDEDTYIIIAYYEDGEFECTQIFGDVDLNEEREFRWKRVF